MSVPTANPPGPAGAPAEPVIGPQAVAARLRQARLAGRLRAAVFETMSILAGGTVTQEVAAEAARVLIAAGQGGMAAQLCRLLASARPGGGPGLETEAIARLALLQQQPDRLAELPPVTGSGWLARWQRGEGDLCPPLRISDLKAAIANGPILYTVTGACPWCGHARAFELHATLLVSLPALCPACFGRCEVTWDTLRAFIRQRFPALVADDARDADHDLVEHVRQRLLEDPSVPEIARALGQEYHFLLNELLVRRRLEAAAGPGAPAAVPAVPAAGGRP